jgi:hypothetical protein
VETGRLGDGLMVSLDLIDEKSKIKILKMWKDMSEEDKSHFINQVALALSVWGSDQKGRKVVLEVLKVMSANSSSTLADFGLYIEEVIGARGTAGLEDKIKRAALIIEGYRIKNSLPSEPHKELV